MNDPERTDISERTVPSVSAGPSLKTNGDGPTTVIAPDGSVSSQPAQEPTLLHSHPPKAAGEVDLRRDDRPSVEGYALTDKLGEGTYGVVWRAVEAHTGKTVAVKFYHTKVGELWQLAWAEIKQLALLDAVQGIIQLKDADPNAEPPYFIMNYAEGGSLAGRIRKGRIPVPEALQILRHIVEALSYVHAKGIRHCDIKPANILLDALGKPLIADFGQAHLSLGSESVSGNLGTFFYMAPDQADLEKQIPDTRWDVYALGAVFYCMVTGAPPRASTVLLEELNKTVHLQTRLSRYREGVASAPAPISHRHLPGMDRSLADIIDKCLSLDVNQRYQSASEIQHALAQRDRYRRQRPVLLLGMVATFLLVLGLGGFAWSMLHTAVQESKAVLIDQLKQSDSTAVNLMANVVADRLDVLMNTVDNVVKNQEYVAKIETFLTQLDPASIADKSYRRSEAYEATQTMLDKVSRPGIRNWVLYDPQGRLLVGSYVVRRNAKPEELAERERYMQKFKDIYGVDFSYRDYFHGQAGDRRGEKLPHQAKLFVSEPYESTLDFNGRRDINIGISSPVYPLKNGEVDRRAAPIGILVGFIHVEEDLANWLKGVSFDKGSAILLNHHGQCVFHSSAKAGLFARDKDGKLAKRGDLLTIIEQEKQSEQFNLGPERNLCLAQHAPLPVKNVEREWHPDQWQALIVHDQEQVFGQLERMQKKLSLIIILGGAALLATVAGLWIWLLRSLRGEAVR